MIIGIDGNEANIENRVGVNEYAFQLLWNLWELQEKGQNNHYLIVYLKNKPRSDMPKETKNFKYKVLEGKGLWVITKLMPYLWKNPEKIEILFSPSHYTVPFLPIPRVCAIMDLGYLEFSGQFPKKVFWQLKWWTAISVFVSKYIISISESTKKDIVRHYPFAENKIQVTYLGYDTERLNQPVTMNDVRRVKNKYSIVDDYILYLGTLKPSKNIDGLVKAFALISEKHPNIQLVVAGKKGWMFDGIYKEVKSLDLIDKVIFTDYVVENDKDALRKGAKVFVQPSFWEGFGIDTLSAMALGVPVVTSNMGSLPEVVGDAGVLVNPHDSKDIARGIQKVLSMPKIEYNKLVKAGLEQASKFSWEKTARETLKILEQVNNKI